MFSVSPELLSPREIQCPALVVKEDVVIMLMSVGSSEMCHINGVEWPVPPQVTCVLCMDSMGEDRVAVLCCNQEVHVGCLTQSFNACGARCPFCVQPLRESPVFQAAALFHGHSVTGQPTNRGANSLVLPSGFPRPPENLSLLCCCRVGPPPQFEPSVNRRMEWSPVWQQSTSAWDLQWICVSCSRTVPAGDIPSCPQVPCGVCGDPSHMVVDFRSNERWNWCTRCQTRVESSPQEVRRTWFSHGLLASLGPLFGWGVSIPSQFQDRDHDCGCFARSYHWHRLHRAVQCGPTGTATILDDTRSRNCGFFGRPFPVTFTPVSCRASPAESAFLGGW